MEEKPNTETPSQFVEALQAFLTAQVQAQHPGFVTVKTSFPELDGTFTSIEVSIPANADEEEIDRRFALAQRIQERLREQFYWGGTHIDPGNHIIPFGKHRGETLKGLAVSNPNDLHWLAYKAVSVTPAFKLAAQWVYERDVVGVAPTESTKGSDFSLGTAEITGYRGPE